MKKFVVAGLIGLTALSGLGPMANAMPLSGLVARAPDAGKGDLPVVKAQSADVGRIGQLEEEIRSLNGRIEEMSFQLLQMQEQIRKF
ncbi:MAG TPA: tol-pal system protein YbgF, partial [Sinorhizobium sp.]|nr:tol-pal system protein YbgF [Sinorhizobium sp.]